LRSRCAWSRIDWYATCIKNLQAACMSAFDPLRVAEAIVAVVQHGSERSLTNQSIYDSVRRTRRIDRTLQLH
jgi:hypothetical protein